jgi:hypothetical protein
MRFIAGLVLRKGRADITTLWRNYVTKIIGIMHLAAESLKDVLASVVSADAHLMTVSSSALKKVVRR